MQSEVLLTVVLPLALGVIMLGLGLSLTVADFTRILRFPRPVLIGLLCQVVLLPLVCFGIVRALDLAPALAVGFMLLAASPGGAAANLYSHLAHGDVALNITLTAVNAVLSVITLPLIVNLSLQAFAGEDTAIPLQFSKVAQVFAVVLPPVALGMWLRRRFPDFAARMQRPVKILSAVFLVLVIVGALAGDGKRLLGYLPQVGLAALLFNVLSLAVGYGLPRLLRLPKPQAVAIGMEIGIHNGTLAITVALTLLRQPDMAVPAAVYGILMFFTAAAFAMLVNRGERPAPLLAARSIE